MASPQGIGRCRKVSFQATTLKYQEFPMGPWKVFSIRFSHLIISTARRTGCCRGPYHSPAPDPEALARTLASGPAALRPHLVRVGFTRAAAPALSPLW